jgi:anti-sigma regulatory factor (Ser/Thr protein kinase)
VLIGNPQFARVLEYAGLAAGLSRVRRPRCGADLPCGYTPIVTGRSELRINRDTGDPGTPKALRHALASFLTALQIEATLREDIIIAVGEAIANAVEHAYETRDRGTVELHASTDEEETLLVDVFDRGAFINRELREGRGLGLRIVRAIARAVSIDTDGGTRIRMVFDTDPAAATEAKGA